MEFETSADLYKAYEEALSKLADNLKKVEDTFDQPELYGNLMQELKKNYHDRNVAYEYRKAKREYLKIDNKIRLRMQVQACVEYLKSGIMNNILDLSDEDIDGMGRAHRP